MCKDDGCVISSSGSADKTCIKVCSHYVPYQAGAGTGIYLHWEMMQVGLDKLTFPGAEVSVTVPVHGDALFTQAMQQFQASFRKGGAVTDMESSDLPP